MATASSIQGTNKARRVTPDQLYQTGPVVPTYAPTTNTGVLDAGQINNGSQPSNVSSGTGDAAKANSAVRDLQAIVAQRGPNDPIGKQAAQLLSALQQNPSLINQPSFQDGLTQVGRAFSQAQAGGNPAALATSAAPAIDKATRTVGAPTPAPAAAPDANDVLTNQIIQNRTAQQAQGQNLVNNTLMPALGAQRDANGYAFLTDAAATQGQSNARDALKGTLGGLSAEQRTNAANYNQQGTDLYNNYAQGQNALNTQDQTTLGNYLNTTNPLLTQLQSHGSNPNDIAQQQAALQAAIGVANGSLDYQAAQAALHQAALAQAALHQYSSDPQDVAAQRQALADIRGDITGGAKNQQEVYDLIKSRTGNQATAEEAFLAEQARRKFESNDRSNREAVMEDLAQRGLRSGSAEIASQLGQRDAYANDRSIAELGLQANAMQRARAYTGMQADQANAMRGSAQNALGLQGNQANAIRTSNDTVGLANTGWANQNSMFNAGEANQVGMFNAGQANQVGMFNAGQTNNARANNQATRLGGVGIQANQSNQIRNSNDAMSQFQDLYAQGEATRVGNLAGQQANIGLGTTNQIGTRNSTTYGQGADLLTTNYNRGKDSIALDTGNAVTGYGADTDVNNAIRGMGTGVANRAAGYTGSAIGTAGTANGITADNTSALIDALMIGAGNNSRKIAAGYA